MSGEQRGAMERRLDSVYSDDPPSRFAFEA